MMLLAVRAQCQEPLMEEQLCWNESQQKRRDNKIKVWNETPCSRTFQIRILDQGPPQTLSARSPQQNKLGRKGPKGRDS